jgi:hypothetical protein
MPIGAESEIILGTVGKPELMGSAAPPLIPDSNLSLRRSGGEPIVYAAHRNIRNSSFNSRVY